MVIEVNPRNTVQGRPRVLGAHECARCTRVFAWIRVRWPDGAICGICFQEAMRTYGTCPRCHTRRLLPGVDQIEQVLICAPCAGIRESFCDTCGIEAEHYRRDRCARCSLRFDLQELLVSRAADTAAMIRLTDVLAGAERPESVLTWLRPLAVRELLLRLAAGEIPMSHEGLDAEPPSRRVEHLRSILEAHEFIPQRDHYLALFERWLTSKLDTVDDSKVRQPVEQFARWHHLARIREASRPGTGSRGPVHSAKQEITECLRFLVWLRDTHGRYLDECTQLDIDAYVAAGPSTRMIIRTFLVWCHRSGIKRGLTLGHRQARHQPRLTQEQRLAWIRELLHGTAESRPYRVAGMLLLLYAQPVSRLVTLRLDDIQQSAEGPSLRLGADPAPLPQPFADLLTAHADARPNQRGANSASPWLFPSTQPGRHLSPTTVQNRLHKLGIDVLAARNRALRDLVMEVPAPIVAKMLGYSDAVAAKHAEVAAAPMSRYAIDARP